MKVSLVSSDMLAAFAAKGGAVQQIETGARRYDERDMKDIVRGRFQEAPDYDALERRSETERQAAFERSIGF